jgi:hypothetical protein
MVKRILFSIIFLSICVIIFGGVAAADTIFGTVITSEGYDNYVDYNDIAGNPKATVYGQTLEATVLAIYGLAGPGIPSDLTTDPSVAVYYSYTITNMGNTTDVYSLSVGTINYGGSGNGVGYWTVAIVGVSDDTPVGSLKIAEDGSASFRVKVTPHSDAQDGWTATVPVTALTLGTFAGPYVGANGTSYGGPASVSDSTITKVRSGVMTLTRVATVDANPSYSQTSNVHIPIPGSMVTIIMTYSNEGTASAESCIIIDKVPSGHQAGGVNVYDTPYGTATGWKVSYTTEATLSDAQRTYEATGWVMLGTITGESDKWFYILYPPYLPLTATYIKWEKASMPTDDDTMTLTWGYIIR